MTRHAPGPPSVSHHRAFRRFILSALPGWILGAIAAVVLHRVTELPAWAAAALLVFWIVADLVTFPYRRRYYTDEPAERRIVGEMAVAVTDLAPSGFVRVHGELWQAHTRSPDISVRKDTMIRVSAIHGLELTVERM